ncbi:MAG: hypothetical protein ACOY5H_01285 [Pseudomonadota bacterium]
MSAVLDSPLAALEAERRLFNPVFKGPTGVAGRYGFRGELALKFAPQFADEARPPEILAEQVMLVAESGKQALPFLCCYLLSFGYLSLLVEALGEAIAADGKYFLFCNNIDLSKRYTVPYGGATFYVLPIDEATAYNELLDLLYIERNDLKKLDTGARLDRIYDTAKGYSDRLPEMSFEEGLERMGPVRNPNENRPV